MEETNVSLDLTEKSNGIFSTFCHRTTTLIICFTLLNDENNRRKNRMYYGNLPVIYSRKHLSLCLISRNTFICIDSFCIFPFSIIFLVSWTSKLYIKCKCSKGICDLLNRHFAISFSVAI